jgi:uncharacterized membrane protein (DUF373 family)
MRRFVERFEHFVYAVLIAFLVVLLFFTLLELGWMVAEAVFEISVYRLDSGELFGLLGYFLLVLIGLELLETIKAYLDRREFHVEIVILVAIIAIARKVILLESPDTGELIGIALIIIALCGGYYLVHRAGMPRALPPDDGTAPSGRREAP